MIRIFPGCVNIHFGNAVFGYEKHQFQNNIEHQALLVHSWSVAIMTELIANFCTHRKPVEHNFSPRVSSLVGPNLEEAPYHFV